MFHSVVNEKEQVYSQFAITKESFEQFIIHLVEQGDKAMDENEYYILRCFFEAGYDYAPSTWQQFKDEW
jgi:hypothetical protein